MSNPICLLCLQVFDNDDAGKSPKTIKIETLCNLLASRMEEMKSQISFLEQEIRSKIQQIQSSFDASSKVQSNGDHERDKIIELRDMIFRLTGENEEHDANFVSDEVQIKVEDNIDPIGDVDDQFFDDDYNSHSAEIVEKTEEEEANLLDNDEEEDDSAFCITPHSQKKSKRRPTLKITKAKPCNKRKIDDSSSPNEQTKVSKRIKLEPKNRKPPSLQATRTSPRTRKQTTPPPCVKSLVISLNKVRPMKTSAPISNSESSDEDNTKSEPGDEDDWVPKSEHDDYIEASDDEVEDKHDATFLFHKCTSCVKSFASESTLNVHIARYHSVPCIVPLCPIRFRTQAARNAHLQRAHQGLAPYQCRICNKKCQRKNTLAAHMVIRHEKGEKKFSCAKCDKGFCLEENLERHLKLHEIEGIKPFVCDVCDSRFKNEEKRDRHAETHIRDIKFRCRHCGKGYHDKPNMEKHERTHTGERPLKCSRCDATFVDKLTLERHLIRDHSKVKPHICHICGKGFYLPFDLKIHLDRHDGKHLIKCDTCGDTFIDPNTLQAHRVKLHGEDPVVCDECGGTFTSFGGLKLHKKIHVGDKKHKCHICGAGFVRICVLKIHVRSHTGERPYACTQCDKAFKTKKNLRSHIKGIHTAGYVVPTPHKCPHCSKGFQYPYVLEGHIRAVHTGERPFTCNQCGKGFAVNSALSLHLKGVHGVASEKKDRLPRSKKDTFHLENEVND
ncbi:Zinc finger protein 45 [Folsomia candida]|uniref:Zinc finger protein 45 n=1 Tax=Folsomia candida TaxID=158441 RepID=A0A226DHZ0_FOLCA|nr:Zinc finger protein 45 [Folsomia candida]